MPRYLFHDIFSVILCDFLQWFPNSCGFSSLFTNSRVRDKVVNWFCLCMRICRINVKTASFGLINQTANNPLQKAILNETLKVMARNLILKKPMFLEENERRHAILDSLLFRPHFRCNVVVYYSND